MNFVGANRIFEEAVGSTNEVLKEIAKEKTLPEGTLLYTSNQNKGKGQLGAKWESEAGKNFAGTFLFHPKVKIAEGYHISMIASLAVRELVAELVDNEEEVKVKWPNDILVDQKKIAGILIENSIANEVISESFIGIGLNINQEEFSTFDRAATSLKLEKGNNFSVSDIIDSLSIHLQQFYMLYKTKGVEPIQKLFLEELYLKDVWANYYTDREEELMIVSADETGLIVEDRAGKRRSYDLKEIQFKR